MRLSTLGLTLIGCALLIACEPRPKPASPPPAAPVQTHEDRMLDAQARDMEAQMQAQLETRPAPTAKPRP